MSIDQKAVAESRRAMDGLRALLDQVAQYAPEGKQFRAFKTSKARQETFTGLVESFVMLMISADGVYTAEEVEFYNLLFDAQRDAAYFNVVNSHFKQGAAFEPMLLGMLRDLSRFEAAANAGLGELGAREPFLFVQAIVEALGRLGHQLIACDGDIDPAEVTRLDAFLARAKEAAVQAGAAWTSSSAD